MQFSVKKDKLNNVAVRQIYEKGVRNDGWNMQ